MYLLQLITDAWPLIIMAAVSLVYATRYILFWNTEYHEVEFEKRQALINAVRRHEERNVA